MSYAQHNKHNFNSYNSSYNLANSKYIYSHENAVRDIVKSIDIKYNPIINTNKTTNNYGDYFKINIIIHLSKYEEFVKINICATSIPNCNSIISVRVNDIYNLDLIKFKLKTQIFKDQQEHEHLNIQYNIENNDPLNIKIENMLAILDKIHDHLEALHQVDKVDKVDIQTTPQTIPQLMPVVTKFYSSVMTSLSNAKLDKAVNNIPVSINNISIVNTPESVPAANTLASVPVVVNTPISVPVVVNTPEIINVPIVVHIPDIINVPIVVNIPEIINVPVVVNTPTSVISNQNTAEKKYIPADVIIKFINEYCINSANAISVNSEIKLNNIDTKDTIKTTIAYKELPVIPIIDSNIVQPENKLDRNANSAHYNQIIGDLKQHLLFIDNLKISLNIATSEKAYNTGVIDSINQKINYNTTQYNLHLKIYNKRFIHKQQPSDNIDSIVIETQKTDNIDSIVI